MPGPRPADLLRDAASDWVLLEINDPAFYHQPAIHAFCAEPTPLNTTLTVIGFPFGAGTVAERQTAEAQGQGNEYPFWKDGRPVRATTARDFRPSDNAAPGMLDYEGPEEARPGMSGGGIFDDDGVCVGIHRSSNDAIMRRGAIRANSIVRFLRDHHQMEFSGTSQRIEWKRFVVAVGTGVLLLLALIFFWPKPQPVRQLKVYVSRLKSGGPAHVAGLKVGFEPVQPGLGVGLDGETDSNGLALIKFTPNSSDKIFGYLICRNEPPEAGGNGPYILYRHGRFASRETREDPLEISRGAIECTLYTEDEYSFNRVARSVEDEARLVSSTNGQSGTSPNLIQVISKGASQAFSKEEIRTATAGWSERLRKERPVISLRDLEKYFSVDATDLRRLAGSVGRLVVEDSGASYASSAFLVAENLVLVPKYALPSTSSSPKMRIEFPNAESFDSVPVIRVPWKSGEHYVALCEIPKTQRVPLKIGIHHSMSQESEADSSLYGRKIAVFGFPIGDSRLPKEINELFDGVANQLAVMPGETILPTQDKLVKGQIVHDATTSGGVSGGPVIDLDSLSVIAMHNGGVFTGERKENQAIELKVLWDDLSFQKVLLRYGKVLTEPLKTPETDPLKLSKADRFVAAYNPTFLGCIIALPGVRPGEQESDGRILDYVNFSVRMYPKRRMALFAAANIDRDLLRKVRREADIWYFDPRISQNAQFGNEIYAQNEFDRGHLIARTAVAWGPTLGFSEKAASSVYYWPNATPQHSHFNQSGWLKLERKIYEELHPESKRLSVFCGPIFDPSDIMERDAQVPRRFWMVGVYENAENAEKPKVHAFLAEQYRFDADNKPVFVGRKDDCVTLSTVEEIERLAGLRFSIPK